ncbi:Riboflavin synthase alpha chain, partial [Quaeritorhiza haematococci]
VCLTVTEFDAEKDSAKFGISPETLRKTNLGDLKVGSKVNLERAMAAGQRYSGHFVQGHVDTTVTIHSIHPDPPNSMIIKFQVPPPEPSTASVDFLTYIIPKGYICLDGTSLTVISVDTTERTFTVMLIAYTQAHVILPLKKVGDRVNLEVDQVGKYVENVVRGMLLGGSGDAAGSAKSDVAGVAGSGSLLEEMVKRIVDERLKALKLA